MEKVINLLWGLGINWRQRLGKSKITCHDMIFMQTAGTICRCMEPSELTLSDVHVDRSWILRHQQTAKQGYSGLVSSLTLQ